MEPSPCTPLDESFPSFNTSQNIIFQKTSYIKIDQLQVGQNPLSYYNSIMNLNTTSLPLVGQQTSEKEKLRKQWAKKFKEKIGHLLRVTSHSFTDSEQVSVGLGKWAARKGEPSDCPLTVKDDKSPVKSCVSQPRSNF